MYLDAPKRTPTNDYLDRLKRHLGIHTDAELCAVLRISSTRLSNYRRRGSGLDEDLIPEVARRLGIPPAEIFLAVQASRARTRAARDAFQYALQRLQEVSRHAAAIVGAAILSLTFALAPAPVEASFSEGELLARGAPPAPAAGLTTYTMCTVSRRWAALKAALNRWLACIVPATSKPEVFA